MDIMEIKFLVHNLLNIYNMWNILYFKRSHHINSRKKELFLSPTALRIRCISSHGIRWMFPWPGHRAQLISSTVWPKHRPMHVLAELHNTWPASHPGHAPPSTTFYPPKCQPYHEQQLQDRLLFQNILSFSILSLQYHLLEHLFLSERKLVCSELIRVKVWVWSHNATVIEYTHRKKCNKLFIILQSQIPNSS